VKIAVFSRYPSSFNHPKGGVESVTVVLTRALAKLSDLDIHVVTLERGRAKIAVEHDGDVTVHRLPGSRWPQILDVYAGPGRKRLVSYLIDIKPDVLHTHETYGLGLATIPVPHVFTVHGFDHANIVANHARFAWIRSKLWKHVERRGLAKQRHIISITPYARRMIEPLTHARIYDIDNPVEERFFGISRHVEQGRVLCVGWINERKNTLAAVRAFARIVGTCPTAKLNIAGEPQQAEYYNRVLKCIGDNKLGDRVKLLGHVNRAQLEFELARASVLLLPSRQENAPMAIAEAMAAGVPVIASNRCGMPYMVKDGQTGFLVDPESTEQIAQRLKQFLGSEELCAQMGRAGRKVALERFHPDAVAIRTKAVYEQVCASAEPANQ